MKQKRGLEWRDAAEDFLGDVHPTGHSGGYGFAAIVGACGYDSDWHCELVVRVSDGLVWLGLISHGKRWIRVPGGGSTLTRHQNSFAIAGMWIEHRRKYSRHTRGFCVILRLRLIQRLWLCGPSEWLS
jgi:hypothetical protein